MPSTIIARTRTGSTFTIRHAPDVAGHPATIRHERENCPPEALIGRGLVRQANGFRFERRFGPDGVTVVLVVPGLITHTSPVVELEANGITIPIGVTRMGD